MKHEIPNRIQYRGATYVRLAQQKYLYSELRKRGGVEAGIATGPEGKHYPGWADREGRKYAEVMPDEGVTEQAFIRVDNLDGWSWEWDTDMTQEDVDTYYSKGL